MKIANHLSRVLAAALFGLGCHTAALHAQNIMLHLDAPQGIDAQTLAADIGTLKITFSNSKDFFDTSLYAANTLDLGSDYYYDRNSSKDKYHKYYSRELTLNADDGNGNAWWGNQNKAWLSLKEVRFLVSGRTDHPIYYRIYNPHFNRIITGQIDPTDADEVTLHHTELVQARRVTFMPPVGRDGNAVPAILAPDLRIGTARYGFSGASVNMHDLTEPFARYAYKGDTLRYLVAPNSDELALHADSIVVTDTTTCVTTDYRKAVECRFYITDSQGQLCPVSNGQLASVYYKLQPGFKSDTGFRGYGDYNFGGNIFEPTAPDGTHAAYVLPGQQTFQFCKPTTVQTTDPDFLMPYNADGGYILGEVTIPASTEPVSLSIAQSKPLRVTTTLADAAPYADHLQFSAYTYVNPPYSWQENKQMSVECKEVSRQIKGNDLVVTTLVEGSTYPYLALNAQYGAQSDTIASVLSKQCCLYSYPGDPRTEFSLTYNNFYDGNFNTLPAFSQLHPVKFIVPCHQFQTGRMLNLFGTYNQGYISDLPSHHDGCAKQLHYASADPIPYDTITIILPEGKYDWVMQKDIDEFNNAPHHGFTLGAIDTLVQRLQPTDFALLRVNCLGVDSIYVYNNVPKYQWYSLSKLTKGRMYYADEAIPLNPGYNERTITWREAKLQKDTLYSLSYWLEAPVIWVDEDGSYYTSYASFSRPNNNLWLEKLETATPDSAICISTGSKANLAVWPIRTFDPARFITINPSEADTTVTVYTQKTVRVNFSYKGGRVPGFERLNMCYGNEQTHIVPNSNFYRRNRMDLEPGHYTMSGIVAYEDDNTGEYVTTPFSIAFDIEANTPTTIELCPDLTAIAAAPADSAPAKAAACYAPDGRRISTPQSGLNIIKMTDGSVRKVIVK